jgi:hypothetical protein
VRTKRWLGHDGGVLDKLDEIAWNDLHHAYGSAGDVPGDLRALRSSKPEARQAALYNLYGSVFHQGTRWEASSHVVPFLVELALDGSTPDRHEIVELMGHLAIGYHESWLRDGVHPSRLVSGAAEARAGRNEHHVDELDVYRSTCAHADALLSLVTDVDPQVRHATAYLLGFLPDLGDRGLAALVERVQLEESAELRSNALIATALLCQATEQADPVGFDAWLDGVPIVAYGAATARVRVAGPRREDAVEILARALQQRPEGRLFWNEGDLIGFAALTLALPETGFGEAVTTRLCGLLEHAEGPDAERLLGALLQGLFRRGPEDVPLFAAALEPTQYELLRTMAEASGPWTWGGVEFANISLMLRDWGLPGRPEDIGRYLAGVPLDEARDRR